LNALRRTVGILMAFCLSGCYHAQPVTLNVNPNPSARPAAIEITMNSGKRRVVFEPEVRGDSLYGWFDAQAWKPAKFALSDIAFANTADTVHRRLAVVALAVLGGMGYLLYHYVASIEFGG
jgi:hypothetical protein